MQHNATRPLLHQRTNRLISTMKKGMYISAFAVAAMVTIAIARTEEPPADLFNATPAAVASMGPASSGWAFYLNGVPTTIMYDLDSRFQLTVTREQLRAAKTIYDIVRVFPEQEQVTYTKVSIRTVEGDQGTGIVATGTDHLLNPAQLELLRSLDYSSNFMIRAYYKGRNEADGTSSLDLATPHLTVVPEREAMNSYGKEALIAYVKSGTSLFAYVVKASKLRAGAVHFTVDTQGQVGHVRLSASSGYPTLDQRVLELVNTLPGTWAPATNGAQEPVEQEFRFTFGSVGC